MLIMLSCGPSSNKIINSVKNQIDNVDCYWFTDLSDFINQTKLRRLAFDRIIFTSKFINTEEDMGKLCEFLSNELNSAEVVMVLPKQQSYLEDMFVKYFDSPMYTVMYIDKPTTKCMVDAVKLPMVDVKARYYLLDKPTSKGNKATKGSRVGESSDGASGGSENKGISDVTNLSNGNNGNITENSQNSKFTSETPQDVQNIPKFEENNASESVIKNIPQDVEIYGNDTEDSTTSSTGNNDSFSFSFQGSTLTPDKNLESTNPTPTTGDLDLTVGEYGSQHMDSGFIGDDELDELEQLVEGNRNPHSDVKIVNNSVGQEANVDGGAKNGEVIVETVRGCEIGDKKTSKKPLFYEKQINIVTGLSGSGVTAFVVNVATEAVKNGKRVLIVDLDYKTSGILSFIDVEGFYLKGCSEGINKGHIYNEDQIDIVSNGYEMGIPDVKGVSALLGEGATRRYDIVLVDCPIDCLGVIPDEVFSRCNIVVGCITDISKVIETSNAFYNRSWVSPLKEKYISENCKVANTKIAQADIETVKKCMVFPNGCWLD